MNDHTLFASTSDCSPRQQSSRRTQVSPLRRTIHQCGVASTVGLLLILCLFLASRRFEGAFDQPLNSPTMLLLGIGIAAVAGCLRTAWPRPANGTASVSAWARLLLPTVAVFLFCYALSLPGSVPWAVALLWFLVVSEEGAWWLVDTQALQPGQKRIPKANLAPQFDSNDNQPQFDLQGEVAADVTQRMTRMCVKDGSDRVFGQARAEFSSGERSHSIHLVFCPPLAGNPKITVTHAGGPPAAITVAQAEPFGTRFDVRPSHGLPNGACDGRIPRPLHRHVAESLRGLKTVTVGLSLRERRIPTESTRRV